MSAKNADTRTGHPRETYTRGKRTAHAKTPWTAIAAHPRLKASVPVEIIVGGSSNPYRGATSDLGLTGCYIETCYPWPVGTNLDMKLQLEDTLLVMATVVTCDPLVGNGIEFTKMLPEDIDELRSFLEAAEKSE